MEKLTQASLNLIVSKKIREVTGIDILFSPKLDTSESRKIYSEIVDPGTLGVMGALYANVFLDITVRTSEVMQRAMILLNYDWEYNQGGSNGQVLRFNFRRDEDTGSIIWES